ncbi:LacI family DNA-binding transcriptional regulator [Microbacterium sp. KSW4-11]|uniref:LacI family DNA-binding transcriptional regulator n=1 Tax=Microbacterium gawkjiense TaxID=3067309 RepID=A0ABU3GF01_9MICO|nr:LacI family DNA-binding transcriptional regulator [Microbacterium sp. KSW4-11]MDT3318081.1 LacI family DNA-binding transcriptional regulator [Microbacterium sp. KSW4-11]
MTVRDIARRANVSNGTVSRVLNNHVNVAADLRSRVIEAVNELGYSPARARQRATDLPQLRTIGFLLTLPHLEAAQDLMAPFWAHLLQGAEAEAARLGAQVTYCSLPGRHTVAADVLERVSDLGLDATLLVGAPSPAVVAAAEELGMPVVVVDTLLDPDELGGIPHDAVLPDYFHGTYLVTQELLKAGHQKLAFVGGPLAEGVVINTVPAVEMRARGFREALVHAGIPHNRDHFAESDLTQQGGYEAALALLAHDPDISGLVCANDALASGAIRALRDVGRRVPEDVSVVGGSDELGEHIFPPLTSYRFDQPALGALAVQRLARRAKNPTAPAVTTLLPVEIVRRQSVHPAL